MTIGEKIPTKPTIYTEEELKMQEELAKYKDCYIFVNTNFKRKSEPIFALAFCEPLRNISIDKKDLIFKTDKEVFAIISDIVKQHFIDTKGKIGIWGNIVNYVYHHKDGYKYIFDKDGNIIKSKDTDITENKSTLSLK